MADYVHGYSLREAQRLNEQSVILEKLLHADVSYPSGSKVLEAGCGVGAQTAILARRSPGAQFTCADLNRESLECARRRMEEAGLQNARFHQADINNLSFNDDRFDHVFVCFVLEHVPDPVATLVELRRVLKPGGTLTVIEGDHGSCFWHPETPESRVVWDALIREQQRLGHDPLIGRTIFPLLRKADLHVRRVEPRWVYADAGQPALLDGVVHKIIVPMVETARARALQAGAVDEAAWEKGISDLNQAGYPPRGTFFYTWFKGEAVK